jgi:hypothetical protein
MDSVKDAIDKGSSLQEAKDRITVFEDYGDFLPGKEFRRWLNRINVGRLYQLLKERM